MRWCLLAVVLSGLLFASVHSAALDVDSRMESSYALSSAFQKLVELDGVTKWQPVNDEQRSHLARHRELVKDLKYLGPMIVSTAGTVPVVNRFLAAQGIKAQLTESQPGEKAVASVLKVTLSWIMPGKVVTVTGEDTKVYPAFRLKTGISSWVVPGRRGPIVRLGTLDIQKAVYATMLESGEQETQPLQLAVSLSKGMKRANEETEFTEVTIPMVDLRTKRDLSWLCQLQGTGRTGTPVLISQAIEESQLVMDEIGVVAKSGVALGTARGGPAYPMHLTIRRPFLIWVEHVPTLDMTEPIVAARVGYRDWKRPNRSQQSAK